MGTLSRAANDFYIDGPEATEALLRVERFSGVSWDPACGTGTIPKVMNAAGRDCISSDIVDRGWRGDGFRGLSIDFLNTPTLVIDNIVTNPPFNLAREFIDCALVMASHKVAMLLPFTFLEGQRKAEWLKSKPLARVHVFSWRISMPPGELLLAGKVKPTGGKKCFAWFVFEHGHVGPPTIGLLTKPTPGRA